MGSRAYATATAAGQTARLSYAWRNSSHTTISSGTIDVAVSTSGFLPLSLRTHGRARRGRVPVHRARVHRVRRPGRLRRRRADVFHAHRLRRHRRQDERDRRERPRNPLRLRCREPPGEHHRRPGQDHDAIPSTRTATPPAPPIPWARTRTRSSTTRTGRPRSRSIRAGSLWSARRPTTPTATSQRPPIRTTTSRSFTYDRANRLVSVTDAASGVTGYAYDANGNRTSVTDARTRRPPRPTTR